MLSFPSCAGCCQRGPFISHPIQSTESWATSLREEGSRKILREWQIELLESVKGTKILELPYRLNQEAHAWASGDTLYIDLPIGPWVLLILHAYHPHISTPPCDWIPVCASNGDESELWQTAMSMSKNPSWERPHLNITPPLENQKGSHQHLSWYEAGSREGIQA